MKILIFKCSLLPIKFVLKQPVFTNTHFTLREEKYSHDSFIPFPLTNSCVVVKYGYKFVILDFDNRIFLHNFVSIASYMLAAVENMLPWWYVPSQLVRKSAKKKIVFLNY